MLNSIVSLLERWGDGLVGRVLQGVDDLSLDLQDSWKNLGRTARCVDSGICEPWRRPALTESVSSRFNEKQTRKQPGEKKKVAILFSIDCLQLKQDKDIATQSLQVLLLSSSCTPSKGKEPRNPEVC